MTKKHHRDGGWVSGHYRNGQWIEGYYRSGTTVSESQTLSRSWSINDAGKPLTFATSCWWCGTPVYFFRDDNGGCALFDHLGYPWPVHSCWKNRDRKQTIASVEAELDEYGYDGAYFEVEGNKLDSPLDNQLEVSLTGFVACNHALYIDPDYTFIVANVGNTSAPLIELEVSDGENIYPFLVPANAVEQYADFETVEVYGTWVKFWESGDDYDFVLLGTWIRRDGPNAAEEEYQQLLDISGTCCWCGGYVEPSAEVVWGLDDEGNQECAYCAKMRGKSAHQHFLEHVIRIADCNRKG